MTAPKRDVIHGDALQVLQQRAWDGCSFITSLPDVSELANPSVDGWKDFFSRAATAVLQATPAQGVSIFFQTDIRVDGQWVSKANLVLNAAASCGATLLFHRVVCRKPPGTLTLGRPTFSHLLCFATQVRPTPGRGWADVLDDAGEVTWTRGMGTRACVEACRFVLDHTTTRTVVDPFCGHGTVLAVANDLGLNAVGVELSIKRVRKARVLQAEGTRLVRPPNQPPERQ